MQALCKATNATEKENAFKGYLPPLLNVWALFTGGDGGDVRTTWTPDIVSLHLNARIEAQFNERAKAQEFTMQIVKACATLSGVDKVQDFRVAEGGIPEPEHAFLPVANEGTEGGGDDTTDVLVWVIDMQFDFVFSTGGLS